MESLVQMTGVIVAILSLCGVIFNYAVIKPLSSSIEELRELIESTQAYIRGVEEKKAEYGPSDWQKSKRRPHPPIIAWTRWKRG